MITTNRMLAAALPRLEKLFVGEDVGNSAIAAFGPACKQLRSLEVQLVVSHSAPLAGPLEDLSLHLPHLTHLTLRAEENDGFQYGFYLSRALAYMQPCTELSFLELDFSDVMIEVLYRDIWDLAPASLQEFSCNSYLVLPRMSQGLCSRLKRLTTCHLRYQSLPEFLQKHPLLEELTVLEGDCVQLQFAENEDTQPYALSLQARFQNGFQLHCRHVGLSGAKTDVEATLAWLPPLQSVLNCTVLLAMEFDGGFLQQLARVLPSMEVFVLTVAESEWEQGPVDIDADALAPLADCKALKELHLRVWICELTTALLLEVCEKMSDLKVLEYYECLHVDCLMLKRGLMSMGLDVEVKECPHVNFPGSDGYDMSDLYGF